MKFDKDTNVGIVDNNIPVNNEKKVISKETERIKSFLRENYSTPVGYKGLVTTHLKICHLWDTNFRLNYWGKNRNGSDNVIVFSMFIKVDVKKDGYVVDYLNEAENEMRR